MKGIKGKSCDLASPESIPSSHNYLLHLQLNMQLSHVLLSQLQTH